MPPPPSPLFISARAPPPPRQNKYKTSVKKKAERQILAVKPSATEEELSAVFEQEVGALLGFALLAFCYLRRCFAVQQCLTSG